MKWLAFSFLIGCSGGKHATDPDADGWSDAADVTTCPAGPSTDFVDLHAWCSLRN